MMYEDIELFIWNLLVFELNIEIFKLVFIFGFYVVFMLMLVDIVGDV